MYKTTTINYGLDPDNGFFFEVKGPRAKSVMADYGVKSWDFENGTYYCYFDEEDILSVYERLSA